MRTSFDPIQVGGLTLPNRVVMAPMTRSRADAAGVPSKLAIEYYSQRASAGLLITEATQVSSMGQLFHVGRIAHAANRTIAAPPVAIGGESGDRGRV